MDCVLFSLYTLSLCPNYWKVTVPQDISFIQVQGFLRAFVTFTWGQFITENKLDGKVSIIAQKVKINPLKSKKLQHVMTNAYSVHFYIKHKNRLIQLY